MKKLLLTAATLVALATPAMADPIPLPLSRPNPAATIPVEYRGEWCMREGRPFYLRRSPGQCEREAEQWIEISAKTYSASEVECRIFKVRRDDVGHTITFDCDGEGIRAMTTFWFVTTPGSGSRGYKVTRLYIENEKW
jgi:hypothetical protein